MFGGAGDVGAGLSLDEVKAETEEEAGQVIHVGGRGEGGGKYSRHNGPI